MEKRNYIKSGFFNSKEEEDLAFKRNHNMPMPEASHLRYFVSWMVLYENRGCFTLKGIEERVSNRSGAIPFMDQYSKWKHIIQQEGLDLGFYTRIMGREVLSNEYYAEQQKWMAYKNHLLSNMKDSISTSVLDNLGDALIYVQALEIDSDKLDIFSRS